MTDLATRLSAIADAFEREFPQYGGGVYREAADALASITRERDAMREGLRPFAEIGHEAERSGFTQRDHEGAWGFNCINVTWGDFRRAAALVNGEVG